MTNQNEARLVAAASTGDARAFAQLVDAHQSAVRGFLRRFASGWIDADDCAQEAFVTAWVRMSRFEGRSSFRAWVCGIGYRIARNARRARGRAMARDTNWANEQAPAVTPCVEDHIAIAQGLAALPDEQRAAVALCLAEGFSHAEAAAILNLPLGTVKSHVARGREKLLRMMGNAHE